MRALERLEQHDGTRAFAPWFFRLLANLGHNRQQSRRVRQVEVLSDVTPSSARQPDELLLHTEVRERFTQAVGRLSDRQRDVIMLHDVEGWTTGDIGEALALSPQTVRWHLHDARKTLRALLSDLHDGGQRTRSETG